MMEQVLRSGTPNEESRNCTDCFHLRAAVSWWCKNEEAIKAFGTRIPGRSNCQFWKPCRTVKDLSSFDVSLGRANLIFVDPVDDTKTK